MLIANDVVDKLTPRPIIGNNQNYLVGVNCNVIDYTFIANNRTTLFGRADNAPGEILI